MKKLKINLFLVFVMIYATLCLTWCRESNLDKIQRVIPVAKNQFIEDSKYSVIELVSHQEFPKVHFMWIQASRFEWLISGLSISDMQLDISRSNYYNETPYVTAYLLAEDIPDWWPETFGDSYMRINGRYRISSSPQLYDFAETGPSNGFMEIFMGAESWFIVFFQEG